MLNLRDYQNATLEALRQGFAAGKRCQILYAPTGAGKTEMAIALLNATKQKGNKAAMILDRIILCDQTSKRLDRYNIDHGVLQSKHWRWRPYENIQVCSAQTLEKRGSFPGLNLLIVDECFPAGTIIKTPTGDKDISIVRCGDTVYNATGVGTVMGVMAKPANDLVKLEFEDGTKLECTPNHPFFTDQGWVAAGEMEVGRVSYSIKGLYLLWQFICSDYTNGQRKRSGVESIRTLDAAKNLLKILFKEVEKPDGQSIIKGEDEGHLEANKAQTDTSRREWEIATSAATCFATCLGGWMGSGISHTDEDGEFQEWLSKLLQTGYCQLKDEDWDRVGWWFARLTRTQETRFEEDRISCFPRLVRISRSKQQGITPVFNLHISGHPSYFANGKLVHNCHTTRQQTMDFIKNNPDIRVIGLTATPFTKGLGSVYEHVVSTVTTKELVNQGVLVPLKVFVAKEIDMTGAKKVAGEWSQGEAEKRGMVITGDIVAEWIKKTHEIFGKPEKTIVFCSGVAHGADLSRKFAEQGYNFVSVSYLDDDKFKQDVITEFSKPDTEIHGLIATDILTKGFDVPDVKIGVSARPFSKSLSSHIQQMGRVMRGATGKDFALWLDHSGNYVRFRDEWEDVFEAGVQELDDGKEKAKKEPSQKEKEASKCPVCSALWPKGSDTCANCGHVRERKNKVASVAGELTELGAMSRENKQDFWSQLRWKVMYDGWRDGRAAHTFKDKFGVWPRGLDDKTVKPPTSETERFIKQRLRHFLYKSRKI